MMHRWHFQRLFRWLIPVLLFIVALCALMIEQKASGGGLDFPRDEAYRNLTFARSLAENQVYGLGGEDAMPAVRDSLWRLCIAIVGWTSGGFMTASYLAGTVCSLITLMICLRLSRLLFPFPPFILYTAVLLIVAPGLLVSTIDGTSSALATMLVSAVILLHIEGLSERRMPAPLINAVLVGLLMWIRIEFALLWIVLIVHAILVTLSRRKKDNTTAFVVTRGITGLMFLALFAFPLFAWNLHVIEVPWPQSMGAPMTADMWASTPPAEAAQIYLSAVGEGIRGGFGLLNSTPFMAGIVERWLAWFGVFFVLAISFGRDEERAFSVFAFLLVLTPVLYGLVYPFAGWDSEREILASFGPICIIAASFGIFRIPFLVESLYRKWKQGLPAAPGFNVWWVVMGSILMIVSLARSGTMIRDRMGRIVEQKRVRESVVASLRELPNAGQPIVTDVPGWLTYAERLHVIDLSGESTPEVLACLDMDGTFSREDLEALLYQERPGAAVIWNADNDLVFGLLPSTRIAYDAEPESGRPRVSAVNSSGVF